MHRLFNWLLGCSLALVASGAMAEFHTFQIDQIFSSADGTIQFVVLHESAGLNGENMLGGHAFTSMAGATMQTYTFNDNLPGGSCGYYGSTPSPTALAHVLIATQGFAQLGLITPDYVIPNGFLPLTNGTLNYAGVDQVSYAALPTDGVSALNRSGMTVPNLAMNFARQSASVTAPAAALDLNQHGLTGSWYDAATSGQGVEVEVFPDLSAPGTGFAQVSWFTYDTAGRRSGPPALVHAQRAGDGRTAQRGADDLSEHRRQLQRFANHHGASGRDRDAELCHVHQRAALVQLHRRYGTHGEHSVDAPDAERDLRDHHPVSHQYGLCPFGELVRFGHVGAGIHRRGQPDFRRAVRSLVHLCADGRKPPGRRDNAGTPRKPPLRQGCVRSR